MSDDHVTLTSQEEQELVRLLTQQVLTDTAPHELAVFDETAAEYFADPQGVLAAKGREEAVGGGMDFALVTPYILALATPVIQLLAAMIGDAVKKEGQPSVHRFVRRLLGRDEGSPPAGQAPPEPLTLEQLSVVRTVALERGRLIGLPPDRAALLADAIAGGISLPSAD
jgi:hypothetical protein